MPRATCVPWDRGRGFTPCAVAALLPSSEAVAHPQCPGSDAWDLPEEQTEAAGVSLQQGATCPVATEEIIVSATPVACSQRAELKTEKKKQTRGALSDVQQGLLLGTATILSPCSGGRRL